MKKIMFNDKYGLTKAVLDGRKTMTRRIVPQTTIYKSDAYCLREGIRQSVIEYEGTKIVQYTYFCDKRTIWYDTPREAFAALIDSISGNGTWSSNPYVFVYEFELAD